MKPPRYVTNQREQAAAMPSLSNTARKIVIDTANELVPKLIEENTSRFKEELFDELLDRLGLERLSDELLKRTSDRYRYFGGQSTVGRMDSSSVDFLPSGIGAVAEDVQSALRRVQLQPQYYMTAAQKADVAAGTLTLDVTAAVRAALVRIAAVGSGVLDLPPGSYSLDSTNLSLPLTSKLHIRGSGIDVTKLVVAGSGTGIIFLGTNVTGITISDLTARGNSQSDASVNGNFVTITQDTNATAIGKGYTLRNVRLENFKGDYWINFVNQNTTYTMKKFRVLFCDFASESGNARGPTTLGIPSSCISFQGTAVSNGATMTDIIVAGCTADGTYIKSFCLLWQGCQKAMVGQNILNAFGTDSSIGDDKGAYAIMAYDSTATNVPIDLEFPDNEINNVRSCGYYLAGPTNVTISGGHVQGQTDQQDGSLPKGAIAANTVNGLTVEGTRLKENYIGVTLVDASDVDLAMPITSSVANAFGILGKGSSGLRRIVIKPNIRMTGAANFAIYVQTFTGAGNIITDFGVYGGHIDSANGVKHFTGDASYNITDLKIIGVSIKATVQNIDINTITNPVAIMGCKLYGNPSSPGLQMDGATKVTVTFNALEDSVATYAYSAGGARGELWGNTFQRSTAIVNPGAGERLGLDVPTWAGTFNMRIQDVNAVEAGAAASKYVRQGWYRDSAAWREMRTLTGN
jgi:hypothetical protein